MEETKYSVVIRGKTFGPFGKRRLQDFVDRGQIDPSTYLLSKSGHKVPASAIPGLRFPERHGLHDEADPELVKRFSSAPRPYPVAPSISAPEETWPYAEEFDPEPTATTVEPTALDLEQPPALEVEDKTVMQAVDYDDLEAQFARTASAQKEIQQLGGEDIGVEDAGTMLCPYCAETIRVGAVKCRFCMEWLTDSKDGATTTPSGQGLTARNTDGTASAATSVEPSVEVPKDTPIYTCPSCRATSPKVQYVGYQKLVHCTTCGFKTAPNFDSPPPPAVLDTPPCQSCGNPTRLDLARGKYSCDFCHRSLGEGAAQADAMHRKKKVNKLVFGLWIGFVVVVLGAAGVVWWQLSKEKPADLGGTLEGLAQYGQWRQKTKLLQEKIAVLEKKLEQKGWLSDADEQVLDAKKKEKTLIEQKIQALAEVVGWQFLKERAQRPTRLTANMPGGTPTAKRLGKRLRSSLILGNCVYGGFAYTVNRQIRNLRVTKDVNAGLLVVRFDYEGTKDGRIAWVAGSVSNSYVVGSLYVELYDKNGKKLAEVLDRQEIIHHKLAFKGAVLIRDTNNAIKVRVNQRDLQFAAEAKVRLQYRESVRIQNL